MKGWLSAPRILLIAMSIFDLLSSCRSADKPGANANDLAATRRWYDQAGTEQACDNPPATCSIYKDQKTFVDVCVAKGFQAKTCGCLVVCSGKINGFGLIDDATSRQAAAGVETCAAASQAEIAAAAKARVAGTSLDRCLSSHVCNGNLGWCADADQDLSTRLRTLARQGCATAVLGALCPEGYQDTLTCPEGVIQSLSQTWSEFQSKEGESKCCIRNVVCGDNKSGCGDVQLRRAAGLKQAINHDGCEYWLRAICAIGPHAW